MLSPGGQLTGLLQADQIHMMIYFPPDKKPLEVRVEPTAMASDVVAAALAQHKRMATLTAFAKATAAAADPRANDVPPPPPPPPPAAAAPAGPFGGDALQYDRPELYVLMLHDGDGLPDDLAVPGDTPMGHLNETEAVVMPKGGKGTKRRGSFSLSASAVKHIGLDSQCLLATLNAALLCLYVGLLWSRLWSRQRSSARPRRRPA
jgi:hypothetical protein